MELQKSPPHSTIICGYSFQRTGEPEDIYLVADNDPRAGIPLAWLHLGHPPTQVADSPRAWDRGADDHNTFADLNRPAAVVQLRMLTPIPRWIAATSTIREGQPVKVVHYTELVGRHPGTGAKHEYAV